MRRLIASLLVLRAAAAHAEDPHDDAIAIALFEQGKALAGHGEVAKACAAFEAAHARVQWIGVELNLADCYARLGRTASAWVLFRKASDDASRSGDARATYARDRAAALEPMLARVAIAAPAGIEVRLDGTPLSPAALGVPLPIDPGTHAIAAAGPGTRAWSRTIDVPPRAALRIDVPPLARTDDAPPSPAPRRWLPIALALGGGALVTTSIAVGLTARSDYDATRPAHCTTTGLCDAIGAARVDHARRLGTAATVIAAAGASALVAAAVVYLIGPRVDQHLGPLVAPNAVGLAVTGEL